MKESQQHNNKRASIAAFNSKQLNKLNSFWKQRHRNYIISQLTIFHRNLVKSNEYSSKMKRRRISMNALIVLSLVTLSCSVAAGEPSMQDNIRTPVTVVEGENAPLTCVVRDLGDASVVWKKWENGKAGPKILSAGETRVTSDDRVKIIHDNGGDVWVLAITQSKVNDSGLYICEVNTIPVLRSFHNLTVISVDLTVPGTALKLPTVDAPFLSDFSYKGMGSILAHNYTACCQKMNVSTKCHGFCTLQAILEGSTGEPTQCEDEFPKIVNCMADGRDHLPCCIREQVPDICQDLCVGHYTIVTDNVKTHFSCPTYIERTLSCIADGIEILPSQPLNVEAVPINSTSMNVTWSPPKQNRLTVHEYVVNVTMLRNFDVPITDAGYIISTTGSPSPTSTAMTSTTSLTTAPTSEEIVDAKMHQIKVPGEMTHVVLDNLQPFTMYEISVIAFNIHGRSLPSNRVRSLTLVPGLVQQKPNVTLTIPDIKSCCIAKGINTESCVSKLCDPKLATEVEIPDLMICAPWTPHAFSCLANGIDHTDCCRSRGIQDPCFSLCSGNITKLDYHYFKCLRYMSEYSNCLLEGYGVLPSEPRHLRVSNIQEDFAIINWAPPTKLKESVTSYFLYYRQLSNIFQDYQKMKVVHPPYVLEDLYSNAEYEIYVEAVNDHGTSQPSQRVVFRTVSAHEYESKVESAVDNWNETDCCVKVEVNPTCLPLCSYDASMSDIRSLAFACTSDFHNLLRCAAGGRSHLSCCERRGVTETCLDICTARVPDSLLSMAENCLPYIGNIVQCFEEGTELIPGPVEDFHCNLVTTTSVGLSWATPKNYNITNYQVFYQQRESVSANETIDSPAEVKSLNTTDNSVEVTGLTPNKLYRFFVTAQNTHGSSIPSSVILLNVSLESYNGTKITGVLAPPHSILVAGHGATWVFISFQPPIFSHPSEKILYKIYHKGVKDAKFNVNETTVTSITLDGYQPNSQYIIYVTAANDKGESEPSETLIAWTDPAHSPFVEPPRISPANLLVENSTMSVMCTALGDPIPLISMYINGKLIKQKKNRHISEVIKNITRDMKIVTCEANNGYGSQQSARTITVSHIPEITTVKVTNAVIGDTASIECNVMAYPMPKVSFWKDGEKREPIVTGGKFLIDHKTVEPIFEEQSASYQYTLKITSLSSNDISKWICVAENAIGSSEKSVMLQPEKLQDFRGNMTECCEREQVSSDCMNACSFELDFQTVINKPQCLPDFDKLMRCSADSRDHRACCSSFGIPKRCLNWCRGEPVIQNSEICALQYLKVIVNCFQDNKERIPGPPKNVKVKSLSDTEVVISWDPPLINPHTAASYRVFWRQVGSKQSDRLDIQTTSATIGHLQPGIKYEAVVKAGNSLGTSVLTQPVSFYSEDNLIPLANQEIHHAGMGVGIAFLVFILMGIIIGAVWFVRKHQLTKPPTAIAFENPTYAREGNTESTGNGNAIAMSNGNGTTANMNGNGATSNGNGVRSGSSTWQTESLHPVMSAETEVPPTFYEELRLGSEGAGFRRLK